MDPASSREDNWTRSAWKTRAKDPTRMNAWGDNRTGTIACKDTETRDKKRADRVNGQDVPAHGSRKQCGNQHGTWELKQTLALH